ncbi:MAG: cytochrome c biogenesis CcdA family protein [Eubacteriales bacterium]
MKFFMVFLEGLLTFISPCILPMLPIYFAYLSGEAGLQSGSKDNFKLLKNSSGFITGFTIIFVVLGAFAGSIGSLVLSHVSIINIVAGIVMIVFGLNFMGATKIGFLNKSISFARLGNKMGFIPSLVFGLTFGISFSPCVGAFLGSALALAAGEGSGISGVLMLFSYSMGLGVPFLVSALLMEQFRTSFDILRRHQDKINFISGVFLILMGIMTAMGIFNKFAGLFL